VVSTPFSRECVNRFISPSQVNNFSILDFPLFYRLSYEISRIKAMGKAVKGKRGFESEGKGIGGKVGTIGVKFPPQIDALLRSLPQLLGITTAEYVRNAVIAQLKNDGLLDHETPPQE